MRIINQKKIVLLFILIIPLFMLISCFETSFIKNDWDVNIKFTVDNANYSWNTKNGTYKYPILMEIVNSNNFNLTIAEFDIFVLNDDGSKLFSQKITDSKILTSLFGTISIPAKKEFTSSFYYTVPYRLLKKRFIVKFLFQNGNFNKEFVSKYDFIDNYFPTVKISAGPIRFYKKGFLDWDNDSQSVEIYAYLFDSYLLTDLEYFGIFEPGSNTKNWDLNVKGYNKDKYYFAFHNNIINKDNFINGEYTFKVKFKEGSIIQASQNISYGNSKKMIFPSFPEIIYDNVDNILKISNLLFANNEIQFYKETNNNFEFIGYVSLDKDKLAKEKEININDILSDIIYLKGYSKDELSGTIYINICSYSHPDNQLKKLKDNEWIKVIYIYSKSIIIDF